MLFVILQHVWTSLFAKSASALGAKKVFLEKFFLKRKRQTIFWCYFQKVNLLA